MPNKRDQVVETAERLFYREGFHATGIDRVIAEAGVARMTLYNHFPSKDDLVLAVLRRRDEAYWAALSAAAETARANGQSGAQAVVEAHGHWLQTRSPHGCLFLKALGEYGEHAAAIADAALAHKRRGIAFLREQVQADGHAPDGGLPERLALLMEGATAYAQVLPPEQAIAQSLAAARTLLDTPATP